MKHRIHGFLAATLALAFVAAVLVTGSCAPAGKPPRLSPQGAPTAASAPVPPLPEPPQPVVATAPAEVQPAAPPPVPVPVPAPVPDPALPRPFSGWVRIGLATDLESVTLPKPRAASIRSSTDFNASGRNGFISNGRPASCAALRTAPVWSALRIRQGTPGNSTDRR